MCSRTFDLCPRENKQLIERAKVSRTIYSLQAGNRDIQNSTCSGSLLCSYASQAFSLWYRFSDFLKVDKTVNQILHMVYTGLKLSRHAKVATIDFSAYWARTLTICNFMVCSWISFKVVGRGKPPNAEWLAQCTLFEQNFRAFRIVASFFFWNAWRCLEIFLTCSCLQRIFSEQSDSLWAHLARAVQS